MSYYPKEEARFAKDTAEHTMTIMHNDGLYRHLRFEKPGTRIYYFDLVTWPGHLTIAGDMGTWTFERVDDMFTFFRASSDINPQYWSEKIRAGAGTNGQIAVEYSEDLFKKQVTERVAEYIEYHDLEKTEADALTEAVRAQILESGDSYVAQGARESLEMFSGTLPTLNARTSVEDMAENKHSRLFTDVWEWDWNDYTVQFLWCCFAIRWGIAQFDLGQQCNQRNQHPSEQAKSDPADSGGDAERSQAEADRRDDV